jgi:hypothetical protein
MISKARTLAAILLYYAINRSNRRVISSFGCRPTIRSTSRPDLNTKSVGMLLTLKRAAVAGFSSIFSFPTRRRPANCEPNWSTTGPIMRHGPHHGAHRSRSTGMSDRSTSLEKFASVIVTGAPLRPALRGSRVLHRPQTGMSPRSIGSFAMRFLAPHLEQRIIWAFDTACCSCPAQPCATSDRTVHRNCDSESTFGRPVV